MYLVHQIILCILYAILLDLNRFGVIKDRTNAWNRLWGLASALYHDDVVAKVGFDKRREDGSIHSRWLEGKSCILKGPLHEVLDAL
jgi:hypothetical protein